MITTSRYASIKTRNEAKKLAIAKSEKYIARGKKTIEKMVQWARKQGENKILVLEEKDNMPLKLSIILVDEMGRWKWASN